MSAHNPLFCEENFNYVVEVFASDSGVGKDSTFSKVPSAGQQCFLGKSNSCKFNIGFQGIRAESKKMPVLEAAAHTADTDKPHLLESY